MRIVFVIGGLFRGGIENWLLDLSAELVRLGHDVTVINISGSGNLFKEYAEAGVTVVKLGEKRVRAGKFRFDTTYKLRKVLKKLKPEVIQTMHFAANYHTRLAMIGVDVPVLTNIHTCVPERKFSRKWMNKLLSFKTTSFVSVSSAVADVVAREQNLFSKPSRVVYNGIPDSLTDAVPADLSEFGINSAPVFFSVARLVPVKNISFFLPVFHQVLKTSPRAKFLIIGDGSERKKLEALAVELSIENSVLFLGMRDDVPQLLAALSNKQSYFVMPSTGEGFLLAGLEAMAFGIPAILSDQIPLKEVASSAALSLPLDDELWQKEVTALLTDSHRDNKMRIAGKELSKSFYFSKVVEQWGKLYSSFAS